MTHCCALIRWVQGNRTPEYAYNIHPYGLLINYYNTRRPVCIALVLTDTNSLLDRLERGI